MLADCSNRQLSTVGLVTVFRIAFEVFLRQLASGASFAGEFFADAGVYHADSFHRTADFETYRQDEHHAAGIGEIFRMMAEHMRCRAHVGGPGGPDRNLLTGFPKKHGREAES